MINCYPKVSIIIAHFDNLPVLLDCLKSCQNVTYPNYEIIIVQNGLRSELSLTSMRGLSERVSKIINLPENIGYACANNLGVIKALDRGADYILLLNDDTIVSSTFLYILIEEAEKSPDVGMLGPKIFYFDDPNKIWFAGAIFNWKSCMISFPGADQFEDKREDEPFDSDYITGCALLIKRKVIEKIGLLDERFFLYWEDVDWGLRAKNAGYRNIIVPNAHIWHKVSVSTGGTASPLKAYHKTRSHLFFAKMYASGALVRLHYGFIRDIAWLLLKSLDENRIKKAYAYFAAQRDYYLTRTDKGPIWLWENS